MGLREKVALAMLVSISTQIVCNYCMPRGHSSFPLQSCTKNEKLPKIYGNDRASRANKMLKKEALQVRGNLTTINNLEVYRFPDVEYPTDFQAGEYYRFLNDYPVQYCSKITNNSSPQKQNFQREGKCKHKYDVAVKIKAKPDFVTTSTEYDPLPHPYCFRKSSFFPEVEYPLSARDTWMPKYWSRLQDARRNSNVEKDIPSRNSTGTPFTNYDSHYENSALSTLIKTLNTKKNGTSTTVINHPKSITRNKNTFGDIVTTATFNENSDPKLYIPRERDGTLNNLVPTATSATNSNILVHSNKDPLEHNVATTANPKKNDLVPEVSIFKNDPLGNIIVATTTNTKYGDVSPEFTVIKEGKVPVDITVSTITNTTKTDTKPESPVSKNDGLGAFVTTATKTNHGDVNPELPIFEEDEVFVDTIVSTITSGSKTDIKPPSPVSKSDALGDFLTTTTSINNGDDNSELPILKDDKVPLEDIVSTISSATNSEITPESSVSKNDLLGEIKTINNTRNSDVITELPILKDHAVIFENIVSTTKSGTNINTKSKSSVSKNDTFGDIVTTTTNAKNGDVIPKWPIIKENKDPIDTIVSTITDATMYDISKNYSLGDIVTTTMNTKNGDFIREYPIPTEDIVHFDNIVSTTSTTNTDIKSESPVSKTYVLDDIVTTITSTENGNISPQLVVSTATSANNSNIKPGSTISNDNPLGDFVTGTTNVFELLIPKEDNGSSDNIVLTTGGTNNNFKPELNPVGDIVSAMTNTKTADIPDLAILKKDKDQIENIVSTTTGQNNNAINSESTISKNDPLRDIITATTNTKNTDRIFELPILEEDIGSVDNIILATTRTINTGIDPESYISKKDFLGDILTNMSTTTPVMYTTSKVSQLDTLPDDVSLKRSENIIPSQFASPTTPAILTTPSPLFSNFSNNDMQQNNYSAYDRSQLDIVQNNLTKDWIMSPNDSYVSWQSVPEYFDDWIIYVDNENTLPTKGNFCDNTFNEDEVGKCGKFASSSINKESDQLRENFDTGCIMVPTVPEFFDDSWLPLYDTGNTTQGLVANEYEPLYCIVESTTNEETSFDGNNAEDILEDSNSTLQYEYVDDTSMSYTEMPYDLIVYPEFVNNTWSAFVNDSYVLYQPIYDYSDDDCLLFVGANDTRLSDDIM